MKRKKKLKGVYSMWLNNKIVLTDNVYMCEKPCHKLGFCPYGQLVEEYPLRYPKRHKVISCKTFGHDCPVFYLAEFITE